MKNYANDENLNDEMNEFSEKIFDRRIRFCIYSTVLVIVIFWAYLYLQIIRPQNIYLDAVRELDYGNYDVAEEMLLKIPHYENVDKIQEQMKYERFLIKCFSDAEYIFEDISNVRVNNVGFYFFEDTDDLYYCVVNYKEHMLDGSAKKGYLIFDGDSEYIGECYGDDISKLSDEDDRGMCEFIDKIKHYFAKTVVSVNVDRVNNILEDIK